MDYYCDAAVDERIVCETYASIVHSLSTIGKEAVFGTSRDYYPHFQSTGGHLRHPRRSLEA